jgi:hypothetical protein
MSHLEDSQAPAAEAIWAQWAQALMSAMMKAKSCQVPTARKQANDCFRPIHCPADPNLPPADLILCSADPNLRPVHLNHLSQCPVQMACHQAPTPYLPHFGYFLVKYLVLFDPSSTVLALA